MSLRVRFWGVRGSYPVPGVQTNRYGGNTSCVSVQPRKGPPFIIDAGTGVRKLGKELMQTVFGEGRGRAHLLISHTHWDHIQGLPFFSPLYAGGNEFFVYARERDDIHLRAVFASQTENAYFPVPFDSVQATITYRELVDRARFHVDGVDVSCARLNHPWIATAYRLDCDGASVVYATDTAPFTDILLENEFIATPPKVGGLLDPHDAAKLSRMRDDLVTLCRGADLLIYDSQFTPEEYRARPHWGHSTPGNAAEIALAAGVKTLALFHHAPERSDDEMDRLLESTRVETGTGALHIIAAHEGLELLLGEN